MVLRPHPVKMNFHDPPRGRFLRGRSRKKSVIECNFSSRQKKDKPRDLSMIKIKVINYFLINIKLFKIAFE